MKTHGIISSALALSVLLTSGMAYAERGHRHHGGHGHGMGFGPRMASELNLTEEQQAKIRELRSEARQEHRALRQQIREMREELHELWMADQPNEAAILAKHAQMDAIHSAMRDRRIETRMEIAEALTPEQRQRLAQLRSGHGRRGHRGHGPGHHRGHHGPRLERLAQQLDLTAEQRQQIRAFRSQAREATREARIDLDDLHESLQEQWASGQPNRQVINVLHQQADALRQTIRQERVRTRIAVLGVLTPEQKTELRQLMAERRERRSHGRHGRRGHRGGGFRGMQGL